MEMTTLEAKHYIYGMVLTEIKEIMPGDIFEAPEHLVDLWVKDCKWAKVVRKSEAPPKDESEKYSGWGRFKKGQTLSKRGNLYRVMQVTSAGYYVMPLSQVGKRDMVIGDWHNTEFIHRLYQKG